MKSALLALICLFCQIQSVSAQVSEPSLNLPSGAKLQRERILGFARLELPTGPARADVVPVQTYEGKITRRSWRLVGAQTTLQILAPLRASLLGSGYEEIYGCADRACGGFAFRFGIDVIPAPDMAVNLSDFQFFAARHPAEDRVVSILISKSADVLYLQILEGAAPDAAPTPVAEINSAPVAAADASLQLFAEAGHKGAVLTTGPVGELLMLQGHAPLMDLEFRSGSDEMRDQPYESLKELVHFLEENSNARIVLVGHTDAVGDLGSNIALSKRRAASLRARLIERYGVSPGRVTAEGVGFLAPLATNETEEGRRLNRRVEAVLAAH